MIYIIVTKDDLDVCLKHLENHNQTILNIPIDKKDHDWIKEKYDNVKEGESKGFSIRIGFVNNGHILDP